MPFLWEDDAKIFICPTSLTCVNPSSDLVTCQKKRPSDSRPLIVNWWEFPSNISWEETAFSSLVASCQNVSLEQPKVMCPVIWRIWSGEERQHFKRSKKAKTAHALGSGGPGSRLPWAQIHSTSSTGWPCELMLFTSLLKPIPNRSVSDSKESAHNLRDPDSMPWSVRSPGEGNGHTLQYYWLENPMDREARLNNPWGYRASDTTKQQTLLLSCHLHPKSLDIWGQHNESAVCTCKGVRGSGDTLFSSVCLEGLTIALYSGLDFLWVFK